jgi:predicted transcriptional regulator
MRLEINIPDSTRPDLKRRIADVAKRLSKSPELVETFDLSGADDAAVQALFTPERLARIEAAKADIDAGNFLTLKQSEAALQVRRAEWIAAHPEKS